jgi:hypothetical protein
VRSGTSFHQLRFYASRAQATSRLEGRSSPRRLSATSAARREAGAQRPQAASSSSAGRCRARSASLTDLEEAIKDSPGAGQRIEINPLVAYIDVSVLLRRMSIAQSGRGLFVRRVIAPATCPTPRPPQRRRRRMRSWRTHSRVEMIEEPAPPGKRVDLDLGGDVLPFVIALVDRFQVPSRCLIGCVENPPAAFAAHSPRSQRATFQSRRMAVPQARQTFRLKLLTTTRRGVGRAQTQTCSPQRTFGSARGTRSLRPPSVGALWRPSRSLSPLR